MMTIYFLAGSISGISVASYFLGKELYRFYKKNIIQKKQLDHLHKLNEKMRIALNTQKIKMPE